MHLRRIADLHLAVGGCPREPSIDPSCRHADWEQGTTLGKGTWRLAVHRVCFCIHCQRTWSIRLFVTVGYLSSSSPRMQRCTKVCTVEIACFMREVCRHDPIWTSMRKNSNRLSASVTTQGSREGWCRRKAIRASR
jgi:hypothetical protein